MQKRLKSILALSLFIFSACSISVRKKITGKKIVSPDFELKNDSTFENGLDAEIKEAAIDSKYADVSIIGHRGDMTIAVTNSLQSFKLAKDSGADGVEFDVRFTKDNVNIIMHTAYLSETTVCDGLVHEKTLSELRECKLKNGEPIRTLEEMLLIIKDWYTLSYLEIKTEDKWAIKQTKDVVDLLLKYKLQKKFVIISYNVKALSYLSTRLKDGILAGWDSLDDSGMAYAIKYDFPYVLMAERYVDAANVKLADENNIEIVPYRVFTISEFERLYELGIRNFMVDDNRLFVDYINSE